MVLMSMVARPWRGGFAISAAAAVLVGLFGTSSCASTTTTTTAAASVVVSGTARHHLLAFHPAAATRARTHFNGETERFRISSSEITSARRDCGMMLESFGSRPVAGGSFPKDRWAFDNGYGGLKSIGFKIYEV